MARLAKAFEISGQSSYEHHYCSREHFEQTLLKRNSPISSDQIIQQLFEDDPKIGFGRQLQIHMLIRTTSRAHDSTSPRIVFLFSSTRQKESTPYRSDEDWLHARLSYDTDKYLNIDKDTFKFEILGNE